jgi:hypothetical protein
MNFLDYLTNAMTGGQPTQQELMARQMAQQGLLGQQTGEPLSSKDFMKLQGQKLLNQTITAITPRALQGNSMSPYMQNLTNPGMTMQQNYIDPRLIEQMYYRGLLSQ